MTDPTPDPLDDLASAHLDGATTPAEGARAASDPAVAARAASFEAVRAAIRSDVPPVPEAARESAIAAALAAFDADGGTREYGRTRRVVPIGARRLGRPGLARVVGVAAAVVLLAAVVPILLDGGDDTPDDVTASGVEDREDTATALDDRADGAGGAAEADAAAPGADPRAESGAAALSAAATVDLGAQADLPALLAAVRQQLAGPPEAAAPLATPTPASGTCLARATEQAQAEGRALLLSGVATVDGSAVVVVVLEHPTEGRFAVVLDQGADCAPLATEPIAP